MKRAHTTSLAEVLIAGVAAYRLARLAQTDDITKPLRDDWLFERFPPPQTVWVPHPGQPNLPPSTVLPDRKITTMTGLKRRRRRTSPLDRLISLPRPGWEQDPETNRWHHQQGTFVGKLLSCVWCVTIWAAAATIILHRPTILFRPHRLVVETLAAATVALYVHQQIDGSNYGNTLTPNLIVQTNQLNDTISRAATAYIQQHLTPPPTVK